eukprot:TRINITY_DN2545_c0_g1_i2.p1 TRINITY_DN2545_c0_g1~~TRINITY_DN2545_c0_g1_i2.p1  ORF type:complete len:258 (-),score=28.25 TRINITY_DN2545_c0_g1_i2:145-918(-)
MVSKWYDVLGHYTVFIGSNSAAFVTEFIGTFFLVYCIGLNAAADNPLAPLAIGSTLMVMIFMGGHISGGHYNPAVTLGVRLCGRQHISTWNMVGYWIVQLLAGLLAALLVYGLTDKTFGPAPQPGYSQGKAFVAELTWTFALVLVMLNSATTKSQRSNSFFGQAIGFTVVAAAWSAGPISGGGFNPALIGPIFLCNFIHRVNIDSIWIYLIAPLLGGTLSSVIFRLTNTAEYRREAAVGGARPSDEDPGGEYAPLNM